MNAVIKIKLDLKFILVCKFSDYMFLRINLNCSHDAWFTVIKFDFTEFYHLLQVCKTTVLRRYNDFLAFQEMLMMRFPYRLIPRLPPKKMMGGNFIQVHILSISVKKLPPPHTHLPFSVQMLSEFSMNFAENLPGFGRGWIIMMKILSFITLSYSCKKSSRKYIVKNYHTELHYC